MSIHLGGVEVKSIQSAQNLKKIESAQHHVNELDSKLRRSEAINEKICLDASTNYQGGDWTTAYKFWDKWTDVEELKLKREAEVQRLVELADRPDFMGHYHDHSQERGIFEKPEAEKRRLCERHREMGNYLFKEGLIPKAAEQYRIAISYYEYCFPEHEREQMELDFLRHACLCNIALCLHRMGYYRQAIEAASRVLTENGEVGKAYYRRAQSYRALDEYGLAMLDIQAALRLCPTDKGVVAEHQKLMLQRASAAKIEQKMAAEMLQTCEKKISAHEQLTGADQTLDLSIFNIDCPVEPTLNLEST